MSSWQGNSAYSDPQGFDVEIVGSFELNDQQWEFDTILVLMDSHTKKFYVLHDSGCSCPMPFEEFTTRESFGAPMTAHEAIAEVNSHCGPSYSGYVPNPHDVISRILKAGK